MLTLKLGLCAAAVIVASAIPPVWTPPYGNLQWTGQGAANGPSANISGFASLCQGPGCPSTPGELIIAGSGGIIYQSTTLGGSFLNLYSSGVGGIAWSINVTCGGPIFPSVNFLTCGIYCPNPGGIPSAAGSALARGGPPGAINQASNSVTPIVALDALRVYALSWPAQTNAVSPHSYAVFLTAVDIATGNVIWTSSLGVPTSTCNVGMSLLSANIWIGVYCGGLGVNSRNSSTIIVSPVDGSVLANVTGSSVLEAIPYALANYGPQPLVSNVAKVLIHLNGVLGVEAYDISTTPTSGMLPLWSNGFVNTDWMRIIPVVMDDVGADGTVLFAAQYSIVGCDIKTGEQLFDFRLDNLYAPPNAMYSPTFAYDGAGTLWVAYIAVVKSKYALAVATFSVDANGVVPLANTTLPWVGNQSTAVTGPYKVTTTIELAIDKSGLAYITYSYSVYPPQPTIFTVVSSGSALNLAAKMAVPDVVTLGVIPGPVDGQLLVFSNNAGATLPSVLIYQ